MLAATDTGPQENVSAGLPQENTPTTAEASPGEGVMLAGKWHSSPEGEGGICDGVVSHLSVLFVLIVSSPHDICPPL